MIRTQIQLDEQQYARLKSLAARQSKSVAQLVREGVEHVLAAERRAADWTRLLDAVGTCHDATGARDLSAEHDAHLIEVYANGSEPTDG